MTEQNNMEFYGVDFDSFSIEVRMAYASHAAIWNVCKAGGTFQEACRSAGEKLVELNLREMKDKAFLSLTEEEKKRMLMIHRLTNIMECLHGIAEKQRKRETQG